MQVSVKSLLGVSCIPRDRTSATRWLIRQGLAVRCGWGNGGAYEFVSLTDLPAEVRLAYVQRECERGGLASGTYDDAAHERFAEAPPKMRAEAERKAAVARLLLTAGKLLSWPEKVALVARELGERGASPASLRRVLEDVEGIDPVNFAPALLADYWGGRRKTEVSGVAWSYFLTALRDGGEHYPLRSAWRDARDLAVVQGWCWPSFPTVFRRWDGLSKAEQLTVRLGREEAARRLAQPAMRDKTSILPLEWVSLDGRTKDFWAQGEDGKCRRYTFLALFDCASNVILGWELAEAENARSTVRLIRRVCETFGIFDRLYTDNGSAFAGHLVAGGAVHRFRNLPNALDGVKPLGICHHLGIAIHFATPRNAQAKIAERCFATLSRGIDDRPEFKGAHAGHKPGASPDAAVVPIALDEARRILEREVNRYNAEGGRRGQGMRGRSYRDVFEAGMTRRVRRVATARQLYMAGLIYTPVAVDRWGRVAVDGWTYGNPETQDALLPYHGGGQRILLGRNPDDFDQPALAYNDAHELICEGILPVKASPYGSVDGIRTAARNRKAVRDATRRLDDAEAFMDDAQFKELTDSIPDPGPLVPAPAGVVEGHFGGTLKPARSAVPGPATAVRKLPSEVPDEYLRNLDAAIAERQAQHR